MRKCREKRSKESKVFDYTNCLGQYKDIPALKELYPGKSPLQICQAYAPHLNERTPTLFRFFSGDAEGHDSGRRDTNQCAANGQNLTPYQSCLANLDPKCGNQPLPAGYTSSTDYCNHMSSP